MELNEISGAIINSAMLVHSELGPGLLEEPYKQCLVYELKRRGFNVIVEPELPVIYKTVKVKIGYRLDLLVDDAVIVELKSVKEIAAIHRAQLLTYLKLSKKHLGLIINFNTAHLKDGIVRMVNDFPSA
jgi:GxxExxY protein